MPARLLASGAAYSTVFEIPQILHSVYPGYIDPFQLIPWLCMQPEWQQLGIDQVESQLVAMGGAEEVLYQVISDVDDKVPATDPVLAPLHRVVSEIEEHKAKGPLE